MKQKLISPEAMFYLYPRSSILQIGGLHRIDFLQRQVTNDLKTLAPGGAVLAALTTPTARILDILYFFIMPQLMKSGAPGTGEESIGALGLPGQATQTTTYLKSRIFFMDQVTVEDASQDFQQLDIFGPQVKRVLEQLGVRIPPQAGQLLHLEVGGTGILALKHVRGGGLGIRLVLPTQGADAFLEALGDAGATPLDPLAYEQKRVEAGLPAPGSELNEEYTPLEVNLEAAISDRKGCYTGQEVIARQITYDKVTRLLVGLRLESPARAGAAVLADGKPAGTVTSAVESEMHGPIALAVVRRPSHQPGTHLFVKGEQGEIPALVVPLPFNHTSSGI